MHQIHSCESEFNTDVAAVEIDPQRFPILNQHWGSVPPAWQPIGVVASQILAPQMPEDEAA